MTASIWPKAVVIPELREDGGRAVVTGVRGAVQLRDVGAVQDSRTSSALPGMYPAARLRFGRHPSGAKRRLRQCSGATRKGLFPYSRNTFRGFLIGAEACLFLAACRT